MHVTKPRYFTQFVKRDAYSPSQSVSRSRVDIYNTFKFLLHKILVRLELHIITSRQFEQFIFA